MKKKTWSIFRWSALSWRSHHSSSAMDTTYNARVAIKKLSRPFQSHVHAKRCYRELRLLRHMNHENVSESTFINLSIRISDSSVVLWTMLCAGDQVAGCIHAYWGIQWFLRCVSSSIAFCNFCKPTPISSSHLSLSLSLPFQLPGDRTDGFWFAQDRQHTASQWWPCSVLHLPDPQRTESKHQKLMFDTSHNSEIY